MSSFPALRDREDGPGAGLTLLAGGVAVAVLAPLFWVVVRAAEVGPDRALSLLTSGSTVEILGNSVALVAVVTAGSVLVGVPLAVLTTRSDLPGRRFWTVAVSLPLVVPSYIGAFAFVSAFGPTGTIAGALGVPVPTVYGFWGTALVLVLYIYPYVFLTTRAALLSFDGRLVEAARTLGDDRRTAFRRVVLPQIGPAVAAGALLVALYALSDFGTPAIMQLEVFTQAIYVEYGAFRRGFAALLSLQLVAVTLVVLAVESTIEAGDRAAYESQGGRAAARIRLGRWTGPALAFCTLVVGLALLLPLAVLGWWLVRANSYSGFAFEWSFAANSVYASSLAALACVAAALPVAYLSARSDSRLARIVERATYVGYAVPGIVVGLALVSFGIRAVPGLYQTVPLLVFAYVVRFLPVAVGVVRSSVLQVDRSLVEAARILGEPPRGAFRRVVVPLIAPGAVAGGALVFLTAMKELPATLLVSPTGFDTLVTYIWLVQDAGSYGQAAVPALVLVAVSGLSMLVILSRGRYDG